MAAVVLFLRRKQPALNGAINNASASSGDKKDNDQALQAALRSRLDIDDEDDKDEFVYNASVNAVYFFLQNYPKLFSYYK